MKAPRPVGRSPEPWRGKFDALLIRALAEARQFLWMFLYLWVLFGLFVLNQYVVLNLQGMTMALHGFAFINAFILAKVMLVVQGLNLSRGLKRRPLIYPIVFDAALLAVMFMAFHVIEHIVLGLIAGKTVKDSLPVIGGGGFIGTLCVALIIFVSLIPFFAFQHLSRAIGPDRVKSLLLGTPASGSDQAPGDPQLPLEARAPQNHAKPLK